MLPGTLIHSSMFIVSISLAYQAKLYIQQLPGNPAFKRMHLPDTPQALQDQYMELVEGLLAADEAMAGSIEGMECSV